MPNLRFENLVLAAPKITVREHARRIDNYINVIRPGLGKIRSREMVVDDSLDFRGNAISHERRFEMADGGEDTFVTNNPPGAIGITVKTDGIVSTSSRHLSWVVPVTSGKPRELHVLLDHANMLNIIGAQFAPGSIIFSDGTKLAEDKGELFWDVLNNRLGLGILFPIATIHVMGDSYSPTVGHQKR